MFVHCHLFGLFAVLCGGSLAALVLFAALHFFPVRTVHIVRLSQKGRGYSAVFSLLLVPVMLLFFTGTASVSAQEWVEARDPDTLLTALKNGGYVKLTNNVTGNFCIPPMSFTPMGVPDYEHPLSVTLDLNGYSIKGESAGEPVFEINLVNLTVLDSRGGGMIEAPRTAFWLDVYSTLNLEGGTIKGAGEAMYGGAVYIDFDCTFNMKGGTLTGGKAQNGGGVYARGDFNMTGGTITGNRAFLGSGVYGAINLSCGESSCPDISGNTGDNVYLSNNNVITVTGPLSLSESEKAVIGITMDNPGVFTSGLQGKGDESNFTSDDPDYTVTLTDDGEAQLTPLPPAETPVFEPQAGTYKEPQTVVISCDTEGASIYYTTDGSDPQTSSTRMLYSEPISVSTKTTIKAIAVKEGMSQSEIASAVYTIRSSSSSGSGTGYSVLPEGSTLPATGLSALQPVLGSQPKDLRYEPAGMRLMLPTLDVDSDLVTVPMSGNSWPVEWLGDQAGILTGSEMPGEGCSVIAGHNTLNDAEYGPFALLSTMQENDLVVVADDAGSLQLFRVYANELLLPDDLEKLSSIAGQVNDALVLVTCENESVDGNYLNRRVVFAKPVP